MAAVAMSAIWFYLGQPHVLGERLSHSGKLQCMSYSPFDKDQSPFDQPFVLRPERMDADLALLAKHFQCIRTYSMAGLEAIPELARKHGLQVLLGAWISSDQQANQAEVSALIASAKANPDVVEAVIVGNEALLRKEVSASQLVALINQVQAEVSQPVTYADVWDFWLQHPEIAPAVDFITIHLLPYWEDQPHGIDQALQQVAKVREQFGQQFAPKEVLIGESGWPSEGRQRETALPSRLNQALFIRGFVQMAEANGWRYNLIEAFDQPWKRISEGAVGGYWGLFDADRQDKSILNGTVSNLPLWPLWLGFSALIAAVGLLLAGRPLNVSSALLLPISAALSATCIVFLIELALISSRFTAEWLWAALLLGLNLLVLAYAALLLGAPYGWRGRLWRWLDQRGSWWLLGSGFAGAVMMIQLVFDPRYRSFPSAALLFPALFYLSRPVQTAPREALVLAALIALGVAPQLYQEGWLNNYAWGWALTSLLLACALWRSARKA